MTLQGLDIQLFHHLAPPLIALQDGFFESFEESLNRQSWLDNLLFLILFLLLDLIFLHELFQVELQ